MSKSTRLRLVIRRGSSVRIPVRVETNVISYKPISHMARSAPLAITCPAHGLPDVWRAAVMNAGGMIELNVLNNTIRQSDLKIVSVVDADNLQMPGVNSSWFRTYTSGGQLAFYSPLDLSEYVSARMDVKTSVGGVALATYSTADGTLEIDNAKKAVWLILDSVSTEELTAGTKLFDIELVSNTGDVLAICSHESELEVLPQITTSA